MLAKIQKIPAFVEFDKGTGNRRPIAGFAFHIPAPRLGHSSSGCVWIESHWSSVHGAAGEQKQERACHYQDPDDSYYRMFIHSG
jgi:hypothetical protein